MNRKISPALAAICGLSSLVLAACASQGAPDQTASSARDTPVTGSHIGKRSTYGPDNSGVSVYGGGDAGGTGGNGLPVPRPFPNSK